MNFICHWQHLVQIYSFLRFSIGDVLNLMGKDSGHMQAHWPSLVVCGGSDAVISNIYPVLRNTLHMASILPMRKLRLGDLDDSFWDGQLRFLPPGPEIFYGLFTTCREIHVFSWILLWASEPLPLSFPMSDFCWSQCTPSQSTVPSLPEGNFTRKLNIPRWPMGELGVCSLLDFICILIKNKKDF